MAVKLAAFQQVKTWRYVMELGGVQQAGLIADLVAWHDVHGRYVRRIHCKHEAGSMRRLALSGQRCAQSCAA